MKKQHVILLAATYRPFTADRELIESLPAIEPPKNYVDPIKKADYVREQTEKRIAELSDLWPLKQFDSFRLHYFDGSLFRPNDAENTAIRSFVIESNATIDVIAKKLVWVRDGLHENWHDGDELIYLGIGIRDILRILRTQCGDLLPIPYQYISDQREVIDPIGMLVPCELAKKLNPLFVVRKAGIELPTGYTPGHCCEQDCIVAAKLYNSLCRKNSQPILAV